MVLDLKFKNKPSQESLYGWFPGGQEPSRQDPKEIYIKLGSRPPRDQSYYETNILYQYHQSLNPSERDYPSKQSASEALKPPWSLHMQIVQNKQDNEEELEKSLNYSRAKSAPNVPTHRIVLKIPNPQLSNLFDTGETIDSKQNHFFPQSNDNDDQTRPKSSFNAPFSPSASVTPDRFLLTRSSLMNDSRNSFSEKNQLKISDNKTVNANIETTRDSPKTNEDNQIEKINQNSNYLNIMNELIDSKYLENITDKYNKLKSNESNDAVILDTNPKYTKRSAYRSNQNNHRVIEVKNIGKKPLVSDGFENNFQIAHNKFRPPKNTIKNSRPKTTVSNSQNKLINNDSINQLSKVVQMKQRAGTAPISKHPIVTYHINGNNKHDIHYTLSDYHKELLMLSQDKKPITGTSSQFNLSEKLNKANIETEVLHTNTNSFGDVKLVEGHWKEQLLNRGNYLQKRPKYTVKIDPDKIKSDPPAIDLHHNASETYFYNTLPFRKATFTINPHFISENLNVKKMDLKSKSNGSQANANLFGPVKYRRDYAFVY